MTCTDRSDLSLSICQRKETVQPFDADRPEMFKYSYRGCGAADWSVNPATLHPFVTTNSIFASWSILQISYSLVILDVRWKLPKVNLLTVGRSDGLHSRKWAHASPAMVCSGKHLLSKTVMTVFVFSSC